ncbi:MAG: chromosome segregation protein SMC, partial [Clostridia bacterium]|nr:chromosome segregation protein SMC [Clostridia bacterium]
MYLKSLELHGFKSFPNRTLLNFERGATVVIGPNGSGKSNISDAMRWVLGEMSSKNIRGTKMEDVIFGGADTRRPMSFAEVTVTFDNSDTMHRIDSPYEEISVTRRYYRSGDSEYYLNRKQCRLRDIHELFMNTGIGRDGYSIIGQGKISEILSKKSEDRRNIFEEAAGIAKYRYRKNDSERKLAETEANMLRLSDVIAELEARVGPLEKDAEKARRYLELYEEKKRADISVWLYDTDNMNSEEEAAAKALAVSAHELEMAEDTVKGLERQYDKLFEDAQKTKLESEKLLEEIREKDGLIARLESEYKLSENETEHTLALIALADRAKQDGKAALEKNEAEIKAAEKASENARAEIARLETEYSQLAEKQRLADERISGLNTEIRELLESLSELEKVQNEGAVRLGVLENGLETDKDAEKTTAEEIKLREEEAERFAAEAENAEKAVKKYEERAEKCALDIAELEKQRAQLGEKEKKISTEAYGAAASRDAQNERADALEKMEEHFEGYSSAVRTVMQDYANGSFKTKGKVYGPLSKLISTKPEHSIAIETALAANIQNIAVDNEETARDAIYHLKHNNAGRATFCPVSSVTPQEETYEQTQAQKCKGCIGRADELVECDPMYRDIIARFLLRTLVFTDLESATEAAKSQKYRIKVVTLDGQVVNPGGSFTGGSVRGGGNGILSRPAQIEKLRKGAEAENKRYEQLTAEADGLAKKIADTERTAARLREDREMMLALGGAEKSSMEAAKAKAESAQSILQKLRADMDRMSDMRVSAAAEAERLRAEAQKQQQTIDSVLKLREEKYVSLNAEQDEKEALREKE